MSSTSLNVKSPTIRRILKEASELSANPDPTTYAAPLDTDLFDWHFTLKGPPATPYDTGIYHGRILLPQQYPLRPPMFRFLTPSGRFEVNREICLSISGHHEETWQPAWGIRTALAALRVFMEGGSKGQVGGMDMPDGERRRLAGESRSWRCTTCCAGTNQEILDSQSMQQKGLSRGSEQAIPKELRFGYKDEIIGPGNVTKDEFSSSPAANLHNNSTTQSTADNQVTHTTLGSDSSPTSRGSGQDHHTENLRPRRSAIPQVQQSFINRPATASSATIPAWIDKVIVIIIATLVVLTVKKVFT